MLIKYSSRKIKYERKSRRGQSIVNPERSPRVKGLPVGGHGPPRPCPAAGHRSPRSPRVNPGDSRLGTAWPPSTCVPRRAPRRGAATGCPRDGSSRPRPLAAEVEKLRRGHFCHRRTRASFEQRPRSGGSRSSGEGGGERHREFAW